MNLVNTIFMSVDIFSLVYRFDVFSFMATIYTLILENLSQLQTLYQRGDNRLPMPTSVCSKLEVNEKENKISGI